MSISDYNEPWNRGITFFGKILDALEPMRFVWRKKMYQEALDKRDIERLKEENHRLRALLTVYENNQTEILERVRKL